MSRYHSYNLIKGTREVAEKLYEWIETKALATSTIHKKLAQLEEAGHEFIVELRGDTDEVFSTEGFTYSSTFCRGA